MLHRAVCDLESLTGNLVERADRTRAQLLYLQDTTDAQKSRAELPPELIRDFHEWKARTPVPDRPLVSICVPTYSRAQLLTERCLPSILGQTYDNIEVIVVGDHCPDDTPERVARIRDPRLTFVNLPERGRYPQDPDRRWMVAGTAPINHALSLAKGDYITHLDDDDEYLPERVERLVAFAREKQADFVWHPYFAETPTGEWVVWESPVFTYLNLTTSSVFYRSWFKNIPWDIESHTLLEPGDWGRFRRIKYVNPVTARYPEPLMRHHKERTAAA